MLPVSPRLNGGAGLKTAILVRKIVCLKVTTHLNRLYSKGEETMGRIISFLFGIVCWAGFTLEFLYLIAFLGDFWVPKTVNSGAEGPLATAIFVNLVLIALFGLHHTVCARPGFKEWFTKFVPTHLERSVYVLISDIFLFLIFWLWQPATGVVWHVESSFARTVIWTLFGAGWATVLFSSFLINHFDLFGVRQVYLHLIGKEYTHVPLKVKSLYKIVRHPIMLGWFVGFWATPDMTVGHLIFALGLTVYGFIGIHYEERTLTKFLGDGYREYKSKTAMILPIPRKCNLREDLS